MHAYCAAATEANSTQADVLLNHSSSHNRHDTEHRAKVRSGAWNKMVRTLARERPDADSVEIGVAGAGAGCEAPVSAGGVRCGTVFAQSESVGHAAGSSLRSRPGQLFNSPDPGSGLADALGTRWCRSFEERPRDYAGTICTRDRDLFDAN